VHTARDERWKETPRQLARARGRKPGGRTWFFVSATTAMTSTFRCLRVRNGRGGSLLRISIRAVRRIIAGLTSGAVLWLTWPPGLADRNPQLPDSHGGTWQVRLCSRTAAILANREPEPLGRDGIRLSGSAYYPEPHPIGLCPPLALGDFWPGLVPVFPREGNPAAGTRTASSSSSSRLRRRPAATWWSSPGTGSPLAGLVAREHIPLTDRWDAGEFVPTAPF
jgi:hypothetical protein